MIVPVRFVTVHKIIKKDREAMATFGTSSIRGVGRATFKKKMSNAEKARFNAKPKTNVVLTVPWTVAKLGHPSIDALPSDSKKKKKPRLMGGLGV